MSAKSLLSRIEKRYAWGFLGFLLGVVGLLLTFLTLRERKPLIAFTTVASSNVLDVHTPVAALDVRFKGQDIQKQNLNLRVIVVTVSNIGDVDILQSFYDQTSGWGFTIERAQILEIRLIRATSDYLRSNLRPRLAGNNRVELPKVILDRESSAAFQLLVIHRKDTEPSITPYGKIAGMNSFAVSRAVRTQRSFLIDTFGGTALTQLIRIIAYGIGLVLVFTAIFILSERINDWRDKLDRQRRRREFQLLFGSVPGSPERDALERIYSFSGSDGVAEIRRLINEPEKLRDMLVEFERQGFLGDRTDGRRPTVYFPNMSVISLAEMRLVRALPDGTLHVDSELRRNVEVLLAKFPPKGEGSSSA